MGESAKDLNRSLYLRFEKGRQEDEAARCVDFRRRDDRELLQPHPEEDHQDGRIIIGNPILDEPAEPDGGGAGALLLLPACLRGEARYCRESRSAAAPSDLH